MALRSLAAIVGVVLLLGGCGVLPTATPTPPVSRTGPVSPAEKRGEEVVLFALGLLETGYRFGGKNPEAGLDCSGMVSYVYAKAAGLRLTGSAADIARGGREVGAPRPGDLVFFNTENRPYSHVGIYVGNGRFVHAPSSGGQVRLDSLSSGWFAARFEEARRYLD